MLVILCFGCGRLRTIWLAYDTGLISFILASTCVVFGLLIQLPVFPSALLRGASRLLPLDLAYNGGATGCTVESIIDLLGEDLAGKFPVLGAGSCTLGLDDDARRYVF